MSLILEADGIDQAYGSIKVLKNVGFAVEEFETLAIIGPNGAGKTTLFKVLTGEVAPTKGSIKFAGREIVNVPIEGRAHLGIARTFQVARVFQSFSVLENAIVAIESRRRGAGETVGLFGSPRPITEVRDEASRWIERVGLGAVAGYESRFLSHGDKKRLEIAMALCLKPRIMMMDEPTAGMSPSDRHAVVDLIRSLREELRLTLLLTEHDMDVVFGLASRVMVLNYGQRIAIGTCEEVRGHEAVRAVYLGEEMADA